VLTKIVGKILRTNYQASYTLNITNYKAMHFQNQFSGGKKSGTPLELLIPEMIVKVKMAVYEKDTNNNCGN
jgi:hypothetical protein